MRFLVLCGALAACGHPASPVQTATASHAGAGAPVAAAAAQMPPAVAPAAPGPRLADGVTPIAYELTLEVDPDSSSFAGHVAITIELARPQQQIWMHGVELAISHVELRTSGASERVAQLAGGAGGKLIGFELPRPMAGQITLAIDYTGLVTSLNGRMDKVEQGLFRERAGGRWYLYSQGESVFARRIVLCFDEPRFKPAWRVTLVAPAGQVALANAPMASERVRPDGRHEIAFAEITGVPSYLVAVAVGPFELVDVGKLGRAHLPVRLALIDGDSKRVGTALHQLPSIVDAIEQYIGAPVPLVKLDLVAVPEFFGAMENPGLILIDRRVLVSGYELVMVIAHELAHQWFGNSVTVAWWDQLWLSEAFASWLGDRIAAALDGSTGGIEAHHARAEALAADDAIGALPLLHPIATSADIEPAFDAIAYQKGSAVLAMFERFVGAPVWQAAVRAYLTANAGKSVGSQAFLDALAAQTSPQVAAALASNLSHAGTPVVELALHCNGAATIAASARDGVAVPVCVRFPAGPGVKTTSTSCLLAGAHAEQTMPLAAGCPAWLITNEGGHGYYRTVWRDAARLPPVAEMSVEEALARGDDDAAAVLHGELLVADALAEIARLAAPHKPAGELAALAIARAIDSLVTEPVRPAWTAWLAGWFGDRLTPRAKAARSSPADYQVRALVVELAADAVDPMLVAAARVSVERDPDSRHDPLALALAATRGADHLFDRMVAEARSARTPERRDELLEQLGLFPAAYARRIVDVLLDLRFTPVDHAALLEALLTRGATRDATWRAVHERFALLFSAVPVSEMYELVRAASGLCSAGARAELADDAAALAEMPDGKPVLDRTLATIDRCIARSAAAGDIAAALAAAPTGRALTPRP